MSVYDGVRTALPRDVAPGATVRLRAKVAAPPKPGRYRLHLEMVHEGVTWFGLQGDAGFEAIVEVRTRRRARRRAGRPIVVAPPPGVGEAPLERATRTMLWRAALMAWRDHPLLGLGPDNFRRGYNRYLGLPAPRRAAARQQSLLRDAGQPGDRGRWRRWRWSSSASGAPPGARCGGTARRRPPACWPTGAAAGLAAYLVHGFFDYFLEFTPTYALALVAGRPAGGPRQRRSSWTP